MEFLACAKAQGLPVKLAYTVAEASKVSGINKKTLEKAAREGDLKTFLVGTSRRGQLVTPEEFESWMQKNERPQTRA